MRSPWIPLGRLVTGRWGARVVVLAFVLLSGAVLAAPLGGGADGGVTSGLGSQVESVRAAALKAGLPGSKVNPAIVVYSRDGADLTAADRAAIAADRAELAPRAVGGTVPPPVPAQDGRAALVPVPLPSSLTDTEVTDTVRAIRGVTAAGLPHGLRAEVTGGPAFSTDISSAASTAPTSSCWLTTAGVVALLLLITYRSPWLWLVPLAVVGTADQVARQAADRPHPRASTCRSTAPITGIASRAGLRRRHQLRAADHRPLPRGAARAPRTAARRCAPRCASAAPAIAGQRRHGHPGPAHACGFADARSQPQHRLWPARSASSSPWSARCWSCPPRCVLFGAALFWPFIPRVGQPDLTHPAPGPASARAVVAPPRCRRAPHPWRSWSSWPCGISGARLGLSHTEQFRVTSESVAGLETLARHFPAGATQPGRRSLTAEAAPAVAGRRRTVPGVVSAGSATGGDDSSPS